MNLVKRWLAHPLTHGLGVDDPRTTERRRRIIRENSFLRLIYDEWYAHLASSLSPGGRPVLELGSGAGFLRAVVANLITSEVFPCANVDVLLNGTRLPFSPSSLRGIVMTDVLHHVPDVERFFVEAARCVEPGGVVTMIEPWVTPWSRVVYGHLHHEPFSPGASDWAFPSSGPLSSANGALPWIVFERDRRRFEREFPQWRVRSVNLLMPFRYLVSGGVSMRQLMPGWAFGPWRLLERAVTPWMSSLAMFAHVTIERTEVA